MKTNFKKLIAAACAAAVVLSGATAYNPNTLTMTAEAASVSAPKRVARISYKKNGQNLTLFWTKSKCTYYRIFKYSNGKWVPIKKVSNKKKSYTLKKLKSKTYKFRIVPVKVVHGRYIKSKKNKTLTVSMKKKSSKTYSSKASTPELIKQYGPMSQPPHTPKGIKYASPSWKRMPKAVGCTSRLPSRLLKMGYKNYNKETDPRIVKKHLTKTEQAYYDFMVDEFTNDDWKLIRQDLINYVKKYYSYVPAGKTSTVYTMNFGNFKFGKETNPCVHPACKFTLSQQTPSYKKPEEIIYQYRHSGLGEWDEPEHWENGKVISGYGTKTALYNVTVDDVKYFRKDCRALIDSNIEKKFADAESMYAEGFGTNIEDYTFKLTIDWVLNPSNETNSGYTKEDPMRLGEWQYDSHDIVCYR